jgi:hypothetical protein
MKYKNGDKVKIKSYQWYNDNKDCHGDVYNCKKIFNSTMSMYCGKEMTIEEVDEEGQFYYLYEDIEAYKWTDDMFDDDWELQQVVTKIVKECSHDMDDDWEFQRAVAQAVHECLWGTVDEIDVYKKTVPTEKLVDDSVEFDKNVMMKKISEYLFKNLPITIDDKESFIKEMNKNINFN